jgi:nitrite reductase/ring-hydroxylating ferredoxin subunit
MKRSRSSDTPLWRDEFPVFTADERYVARRQFTKFLTLTSLAMFAGNMWILARSWFERAPSFPHVLVARSGELPAGAAKIFAYPTPADPCILVRTAAGEFAAFSQKCTHLSCAVYYSRASGHLECPCHQGVFAAEDGAALAGPPRRPLPRVILERQGDQLIAVGMREGGPA